MHIDPTQQQERDNYKLVTSGSSMGIRCLRRDSSGAFNRSVAF